MRRFIIILMALMLVGALGASAMAGSVFLTGHDPDFHAYVGGNSLGAQHINQTGIGFVMNPGFNPFVAGGATKFLWVESQISPPAGHVNGVNGIIASGYVSGVDFDLASAATLNNALNGLGTTYGAIVVASDFGGVLTQAELDILNSRKADIINFLNNGGGLYAMAESDSGAGLTPNDTFFGYLPFVVSSAQKNESEVGNTVTPFGAGLGLTVSDINGNASHNVFNGTFGLDVVDFDASGDILTVAGRPAHIAVPVPASALLLSTGLLNLLGLGYVRRRQRG